MRALSIAATGMLAQQTNVEVIANNLANMNTTAYKEQRAEFQDLLYQNIEQPGSQSSDSGTLLPSGIQLGAGVIAGWNQGLAGVPVGSRVMLVIPPSLGYGPAGGQASAGITKTDSLVFVIDVLGARPASH